MGWVRDREPYTRSFQIGCHLDRGDVPPPARCRCGAAGPALGEGGRLLQHSLARLLAVEGRSAEALAALDAIPMPVPVRNPVWNPWLTTAAIALDRLGRTGRGGDADAGGGGPAAPVGRAELSRDGACRSARAAGTTASPTCGRRWRC